MEVKKYNKLNETVYTYTHSSGAKIYLVAKPGFSKSAAYFTTHYGSIDNHFTPIGTTEMIQVPDGIAHFLEHKMFEMPQGENVFEMFGKNGASANAYTSFNMTAYYFWCTSHFEESLKILLNYVQTPYFTEENVAKEQGIIGQEIRMYDDNPTWRSYFNMISCLYEKHPVRVDIAGTVESIAKITKDTLYTCYNTFYHPSNMVICAVGDFKPEKIKELIDGNLKPLENAPEIRRTYPEEGGIAKKEIEVNLSVSMPIFAFGFKDPVLTSGIAMTKRKLAVNLLLEILFGRSSDFYTEQYNSGLINGSFGFDYTVDESFAFTEITGESKDPKALAKNLLHTIQNSTITNQMLQQAKRKLYGEMMKVFDSPDDYADQLSRSFVLGMNMYDAFEVIDDIQLDQIEELFESHLKESNFACSIVNPVG